MTKFDTTRLPVAVTEVALDGSDVRLLLALPGGVMAHYELAPGKVSAAVANRTVDQIWFFVSGRGDMWRLQGGHEETVPVEAGVCITIPRGHIFNFDRSVTNLWQLLAW